MTDATRKIYVVLPLRQIEALERIAARQKRTFSSVVRESVEEFTGVQDTVQVGGVRDKRAKSKA